MYNGSHGLQFLSYLILPAFGSTDIILLLHIKWSMVKDGKRQPKMRRAWIWEFWPPSIGWFFFFLHCHFVFPSVWGHIRQNQPGMPQFPSIALCILFGCLYYGFMFYFSLLSFLPLSTASYSWTPFPGHSWMSSSGYSRDLVAVATHLMFFHSVLTSTCNSFMFVLDQKYKVYIIYIFVFKEAVDCITTHIRKRLCSKWKWSCSVI